MDFNGFNNMNNDDIGKLLAGFMFEQLEKNLEKDIKNRNQEESTNFFENFELLLKELDSTKEYKKPKEKLVSFDIALKALKQGEKIRRQGECKGCYFYVNDGHLKKFICGKNYIHIVSDFNPDDILAEDWIILD